MNTTLTELEMFWDFIYVFINLLIHSFVIFVDLDENMFQRDSNCQRYTLSKT